MSILFRPVLSSDYKVWIPALREHFDGLDLRIEGEDDYDPQEIEYLILWGLKDDDATNWPNLKAVLTLGAGVNQYVGHPEFPQHAQLIRMIDHGLTQSMVEYVSAYVLRLHREQDDTELIVGDQHEWFDYIPSLSQSRTIGFLGLGVLAQACIEALKPFGFQIQGWSRSEKNIDGVASYAGDGKLQDFLQGTDILVNLLPLTDATRDILNKEHLQQLPKGAALINVARGPHVVDEDLIECIETGHISRAVLDVFRKEPLPQDHPFWKQPKIHITPHIGGVTIPQTAVTVLRQSIEMLERGEVPAGLVDIKAGY